MGTLAAIVLAFVVAMTLPLASHADSGSTAPGTELGPIDGFDLPGEETGRVVTGDAAPDFVLEDIRGKRVRLSSFRAKSPVVLVFYRGKW